MAVSLNRHFVEMLRALSAAGADFMIVGAHALAAHGHVRGTLDFDIWVRPDHDNAERVWHALVAFGAPLQGLTLDDLKTPGTVYQIGVTPSRIDVINELSGLAFDDAWPRRMMAMVEGEAFPVIGREDLLRNKRATGRPQDLADVAALERLPKP